MNIIISDQITQAIQLLPTEMQAAFFSVYFAYVTTGAMPNESVAPEVRAMFILAKPQIDRLNRAAIRKREAAQTPPPQLVEKPHEQPTPTEKPDKKPLPPELKSGIASIIQSLQIHAQTSRAPSPTPRQP